MHACMPLCLASCEDKRKRGEVRRPEWLVVVRAHACRGEGGEFLPRGGRRGGGQPTRAICSRCCWVAWKSSPRADRALSLRRQACENTDRLPSSVAKQSALGRVIPLQPIHDSVQMLVHSSACVCFCHRIAPGLMTATKREMKVEKGIDIREPWERRAERRGLKGV